MADTFEVPSHKPLKWGHLVGFAATIAPTPVLKHPALGAVAQTFLGNIQRVKWMLLAPTLVGDLTIDIQRCFGYAEFRVSGEVIDSAYSVRPHPRHVEIANLAQRIFDLITEEKLQAVGTPEWDAYVMGALQRGTQPVLMLESAPAAIGLEAMLSSAITGTWTAFETMAGDLWEAALNAHPDGLAELKGK
jgi:hypothetical protein